MPKNRNQDLVDLQNSRTAAMLMVLAEDGINQATFTKEVRAVAAAAAEQGDFSAAMKGYELIGKALGSFAPEVHHHILTPGIPKHEDLARLSDAELERLAYESAKPVQFSETPPLKSESTHRLCLDSDSRAKGGEKNITTPGKELCAEVLL